MKRILLITLLFTPLLTFSQVNEITFNHQGINFSAAPRTAISPMSIKMWDNYQNGGPSTYGTVLEFYGFGNHQTGQLYFGGWDNSKIRYREAFYAQNTWSEWMTLLDSKNDVESNGSLKISGAGNHYILNGKVGIGTINPHARLDIRNQFTNPMQAAYIEQGEFNQITLQLKNTNTAAITPILQVDNTLQTIFCVKPQGNVGIGTTLPSSKFEVAGENNGSSNNSWINLDVGQTSNPRIFSKGWNANFDFYTYNIGGSPNLGQLHLNTNGNVGIGTTTPGNYRLNVNGKIRADEIVVNTTGADFVFEPDYKLRSLSELETFIRTNKHLPDIAPAKEMQQNGVSAGEMQAKLLQKVEELTLYVIEKDKQINNQNQIISQQQQLLMELKQEIEKLKQN